MRHQRIKIEMEDFNITHIIERYGLTDHDMAVLLWPEARFPLSALKRLKRGESCLNEKQIARIAAYLGVTVSDLLATATGWQSRIESGAMTLIKRFPRATYRVLINYRGSFVTIMRNNVLAEQLVVDTSAFTLDGFLNFIDININRIENGNNQD